jgi:glyoxylase-like metal-dependent hydrolase (beta-lactamase superfamily II)
MTAANLQSPSIVAPMTTMKQEQAPASEEVTEAAPGVLRLQLPVDMPGLGHVNCYALEDERGVALVDPGMPGPLSWTALVHRLAQAGIPVSRVHTVVVTHSHPDHFGLAGRLQDEFGARLVTHAWFRFWWNADDPVDVDIEDELDVDERNLWLRPTPWGGEPYQPPPTMAGMPHEEFRRALGNPVPTERVEDADVLTLGRREWVAVHTPGHTPDHLCLLDPASGIMLTGDHVLPSITPHISGIGPIEDPLAQFFESLDRVMELDGVRYVLPAHGHPFHDLAGRAKEIKRHHEERLARLREASAALGRPASVTELSEHLFSPRARGSMAESETYAHLEHLHRAGRAERREQDGVLLYSVS